MKTRIYLKVAHEGNKTKVQAMTKANHTPLFLGTNYRPKYLPTVLVALDLDIDDKEFSKTRILLDTKIESVEPAIEIKQIEVTK